jgi:thioredoxin 2
VTQPGYGVVQCQTCGTKNRVPWQAKGLPRCQKCKSALPWLAEAGDSSFAEVVTASVLPVLVDVWAPWCAPCRAISPSLERLANDKAGQIKLVKINADESPQVSARFGIQAIPTLLILHGGRVISRQTGAAPEPQLRAWLDEVLSSVSPGRG